MKIFKRKKKVEGLDFDKYKLRLTVKAICMFEKLTGKSFYEFTDDDIVTLMYCAFVSSNNLDYRLSTFIFLLEDERVSKWFGEKFVGIMDYIKQFPQKEEEGEETNESTEMPFVSDLANALIVQYGVDAHYIMEEMELWQIEAMFRAVENTVKSKYEEERLWTYLTILPQVDGKKLNKPEKLLPFPWEKEEKIKRDENNIKNNEYAVKNLIGRNIHEILNGTR